MMTDKDIEHVKKITLGMMDVINNFVDEYKDDTKVNVIKISYDAIVNICIINLLAILKNSKEEGHEKIMSEFFDNIRNSVEAFNNNK